MSGGLLTVGGKEVGEARALIAGDMFHDHGDAVRFGIELVEKFVVAHLRDGSLSETFVSAHAASDLVEIRGFEVCAHARLRLYKVKKETVFPLAGGDNEMSGEVRMLEGSYFGVAELKIVVDIKTKVPQYRVQDVR